jgi:hypothetical protein
MKLGWKACTPCSALLVEMRSEIFSQSGLNPPNLCLRSCWDCRCELPISQYHSQYWCSPPNCRLLWSSSLSQPFVLTVQQRAWYTQGTESTCLDCLRKEEKEGETEGWGGRNAQEDGL